MTSIAGGRERARFTPEPFPVFVIDNALDEDAYRDLANVFPSLEEVSMEDGPVANNTNYTRSARHVIDNPVFDERWRRFFRHHVSPDFWQEILPLVGDAILSVHSDIEERAGRPLSQMSVAMRGSPDAEASDIRLDCQFAMNSPVTETSTVRAPHIDHRSKIFNALLYCRPPEDDTPGGELEIFRFRGKPAYRPEGRTVLSTRIEAVQTVPYRANTLVLFVNSPLSVHGVTPRPVTPHARRYINFLCEFREPLFELPKTPLWRWKSELMLDRLRQAGRASP